MKDVPSIAVSFVMGGVIIGQGGTTQKSTVEDSKTYVTRCIPVRLYNKLIQ